MYMCCARVCVLCVYVCTCMLMCLQRPEKGNKPSGAGVIGHCELPIWVLGAEFQFSERNAFNCQVMPPTYSISRFLEEEAETQWSQTVSFGSPSKGQNSEPRSVQFTKSNIASFQTHFKSVRSSWNFRKLLKRKDCFAAFFLQKELLRNKWLKKNPCTHIQKTKNITAKNCRS